VRQPGPAHAAGRLGLIAAAGLGLGVLTLAGQGFLDGNWNRLANSGAIWLLVAWLVGSRMPTARWATAAGFVVLASALAGYYVAARLSGAGVSASSVAIWLGTALIGGPVYGLAGRWWRVEADTRRIIAIGLAGGIFAAEGISTLIRTPELAVVGWVELVAGVLLSLALGRTWRERAAALVVVLGVIVLGGAAYEIVDRLMAAR
jgi:hypothetical protein